MIVRVWLISLFFTPVVVSGYEIITVTDGGSIQGTVKYQGPYQAAEVLNISKDQEVCGKTEKVSESLIIGANHGVQNAVVSLADVQKGKRPILKNVMLDQKGCRYNPHVLLLPTNVEAMIVNDDGILHNFHTHSQKNPPINKAQPKFKRIMKEKFTVPEIIKVTCDAHAWMLGWLVVTEHPYYAITDANGNFQIADIPPGEYVLSVWHETLNSTARKIRIHPTQVEKVDIELQVP